MPNPPNVFVEHLGRSRAQRLRQIRPTALELLLCAALIVVILVLGNAIVQAVAP